MRPCRGREEGQRPEAPQIELPDDSCHSMRRQGITMDELTSFQPRLPTLFQTVLASAAITRRRACVLVALTAQSCQIEVQNWVR